MSQLIGDLPDAQGNPQGGFDFEIDDSTDLTEITGIQGSDGSDQVTNNQANTLEFGLGGGDDTYTGTPGAVGTDTQERTIFAGEGNDIVQTGAGEVADVFGGSGDDFLVSGFTDDTLRGGEGNDTIQGGSGDDELFGGIGDDELFGNRGRDTLTGGEGNDTLDGGADRDTLTGEAGADVFRFELLPDVPSGDNASDVFAGGELDVITDFDLTEDTLAFDDDFFSDETLFSVEASGDGGTTISYDGSAFLNLEGVNPDDINPEDFELF